MTVRRMKGDMNEWKCDGRAEMAFELSSATA
jgi:hypothetical protein